MHTGKTERISVNPVVAAFIKNECSQFLWVPKGRYFTLITGHMELKDITLERTVKREVEKESGVPEKQLTIVESLGVFTRIIGIGMNNKMIQIFYCKAPKKEVRFFNEPDGKGFYWKTIPKAKESFNLDDLANTAIEYFLKKYPLKNRGGTNEASGYFGCRVAIVRT
ncbi:MAG: NUDIX domain-containing protein [bacterium]